MFAVLVGVEEWALFESEPQTGRAVVLQYLKVLSEDLEENQQMLRHAQDGLRETGRRIPSNAH
jgi:hypothetical protein